MVQDGSQQSVSLGDCRLDLSRRLLLRDGAPVALRAKAFALLAHLAENSGRVVGKDELIAAVWPDTFVTEDSLTQVVREVRKALGPAHDAIKTVARRGYLLMPPAAEEPADSRPSVAVLRFVNEGGDADEPVVDGFAEDIVNCLAAFRRVAVLARNSSFAFDSSVSPDWRGVGARLGADYLVRGRMRLSADALHASISLVEATSAAVLWSENFAADGDDIFALRQEIASKIVNRLVSRIDDASVARVAAKPPANLAAYDLLLRGLARFRGYRPEDNFAAKDFFERACQKDPEYGLAHAYCALVELAIGGCGEASQEVVAASVVRAAVAVNLSPEEPRCHRVLAICRMTAREFVAAEHHIRHALRLNPSDAETMQQTGYLLTMRGRPFDAIEWFDRAVRINPFHPDWYHYDRGLALYAAGQYADAAACFSMLPHLTAWRLTRLAACHAQSGDLALARRILAEVEAKEPGYVATRFPHNGDLFEHRADAEHWMEGLAKALGE